MKKNNFCRLSDIFHQMLIKTTSVKTSLQQDDLAAESTARDEAEKYISQIQLGLLDILSIIATNPELDLANSELQNFSAFPLNNIKKHEYLSTAF
ncbi:MAG: hypothetical protein ACXWQQ_02060 [Pseudobdellovibrio sp.]